MVREGRGGEEGGKLLSFYKQQTLLQTWSGLHRESPSERVVYFELSHNFCCVFVVSTARIIRLKHDSIGKLNLNFVLKVPLIMQN